MVLPCGSGLLSAWSAPAWQMDHMPGMSKGGMDMGGKKSKHGKNEMGDMGPSMAAMAGHMAVTPERPVEPGDEERAKAVIAEARTLMERYKDYHKAQADGYVFANPEAKQTQYHFMNKPNGEAADTHFDASKPTALLYLNTPHKDFKLEGVMYTAAREATEDELNARVPLSIARWHEHINFCAAPADRTGEYFGKRPTFGMFGSVKTKEACDAARGVFYPYVFTWMIHVFPFEKNYKDIFSMNDDIPHVHGVGDAA